MNNENKLQTASEKAAVMIAFDRGEKVERCVHGYGIWSHDSNPHWDWNSYEWRVMAKPIEYWVWVHSDGIYGANFYDSKHKIENVYKGNPGRAAFMREVI